MKIQCPKGQKVLRYPKKVIFARGVSTNWGPNHRRETCLPPPNTGFLLRSPFGILHWKPVFCLDHDSDLTPHILWKHIILRTRNYSFLPINEAHSRNYWMQILPNSALCQKIKRKIYIPMPKRWPFLSTLVIGRHLFFKKSFVDEANLNCPVYVELWAASGGYLSWGSDINP